MEFEENIYYDQSDIPDVFEVTIVENPSANQCGLRGKYHFHVNSLNFSIVEPTSKEVKYIWPFRYIRRYGRSDTNFQFEAGRKCRSGPGLFSLLTEEGVGEDIFTTVQSKFKRVKEQDQEFASNNPTKLNQATIGKRSPTLPARQYSMDEKPIPKPKPQVVPKPSRLSTSQCYDDIAGEYCNTKFTVNSKKPPTTKTAKPLTPTAPKPILPSAPKPTPKPKVPAAATAADVNKLISNNKSALKPAAEDQLYDTFHDGTTPQVENNYGAYGDLYSSLNDGKTAPSVGRNTGTNGAYDEIEPDQLYDEIKH